MTKFNYDEIKKYSANFSKKIDKEFNFNNEVNFSNSNPIVI